MVLGTVFRICQACGGLQIYLTVETKWCLGLPSVCKAKNGGATNMVSNLAPYGGDGVY